MSKHRTLGVWVSFLCLAAAAGCGRHEDPLAAAKLHLKRGQFTQVIDGLRAAPDDIRNTYEAQMLLAEAYLGTRDKKNYDKSYEAFRQAARLDKTRVEPLLGMARVKYIRAAAARQTDPKLAREFEVDAISHCQEALRADPNNAEAYTLIGDLRLAAGQPNQAVEMYRAAVQRNPDDPDLKLRLARILLRLGERTEAARLVDEALGQKPDLPAARILKARILRRARRLEEAKKELLSAIESTTITPSERADALLDLAQLSAATGEQQEAKEYARDLIKLKRHRYWAYLILGSIYLQEQQWKQAFDHLSPLAKNLDKAPPHHPIVLMRLALAELKLDKKHQAISHYKYIVEKMDPRFVPAHKELARLMIARRMYDEAMKHCRAVLKERPGDTYALRLMALIHRSRGSGKHFSYARALNCYIRILARRPNDPSPNLEVARMWLEMGQPVRARQFALAALRLRDDAAAHLVLGRIYLQMHFMGVREVADPKPPLDRAIQHLRQARTLAPDKGPVMHWLAQAYLVADKPQEAVRILRPFVVQHPRVGSGYLVLARVYERMGRLRDAIRELERAARVHGVSDLTAIRSSLGRVYFLAGHLKEAIGAWRQLLGAGQAENLGVNVGLAVALALDGKFDDAMARAEAVAQEPREASGRALVAACVAIQAGRFDKAKDFLDRVRYPSRKERDARLRFPELCRQAGSRGRKAAALISESILHIEFQSPDAAVKRLDQAMLLVPDSIIPYYVKAEALLRSRRYRQFLQVYQTVFKKFRGHGYPHYHLAQVARRLPGLANYRDEITAALDLDPELAGAQIAMAQILLSDARRDPKLSTLQAAVRYADEGRRLDGGTRQSLYTAADAHSAKARLLRLEALKEKDPSLRREKQRRAAQSTEVARQMLRLLRQKFPTDPRAARAVVRFEIAQKNYAKAAGDAVGFLQRVDWKTDQPLLLLAARAFRGLRKYGEALKYLRRILRINRASAAAYLEMADVYADQNRPRAVLGALETALRLLPTNRRIAFALAAANLRYGRAASARAIYRDILTRVPPEADPRTHTRALLGLARALIEIPTRDREARARNLSEAATTLKKLVAPPGGTKPHPEAMVLMGRVLESQDRDLEALALYKKCVKEYPKYLPAYRQMTLLRYRRHEFDEAIALHMEAGRIRPLWRYDPGALARVALLFLARGRPGDPAGAARITRLMIDYLALAGPEQAPSGALERYYRNVRVIALVADRKTSRAREEVHNLRDIEEGIRDAYVRLVERCGSRPTVRQRFVRPQTDALFYRLNQRAEREIAALRKARETAPENLFLLWQLANAYLRKDDQEHYVEILKEMLRAAPASNVSRPYHQKLYTDLIDAYLRRLYPNDKSVLEEAFKTCLAGLARWPANTELLQRKARIHQFRNQPQDAIATFQKIAQNSARGGPAWIDAKKNLALAYYATGHTKKAAALCDEIFEYIRHDPAWLNNAAWFQATAPEPNLDKALQLAQKGKEIDPSFAMLRDTLGWIYYLKEDYGRALPELEYAHQELPRDANVCYHLGATQYRVGLLRKAHDTLRRALELYRKGSKLDDAAQCRKLLAEIQRRLEARE